MKDRSVYRGNVHRAKPKKLVRVTRQKWCDLTRTMRHGQTCHTRFPTRRRCPTARYPFIQAQLIKLYLLQKHRSQYYSSQHSRYYIFGCSITDFITNSLLVVKVTAATSLFAMFISTDQRPFIKYITYLIIYSRRTEVCGTRSRAEVYFCPGSTQKNLKHMKFMLTAVVHLFDAFNLISRLTV